MRRTITFAAFIVLLAAAAACGPPTPSDDDDDDDVPDAPSIDAPGSDVDAPEDTLADVYAHTATTLYSVDPDTLDITMIGNFTGDAEGDEMTDIAVDGDGNMVGISFTRVYTIDTTTAITTRAGTGKLSQEFNGLSFVPSMEAFGTPGPDVLIAGRNADGVIFRIDPATGVATQIGDMGPQFATSGDIVAVAGFGIVATSSGGALTDALVRLAPNTFAATVIGAGTGYHTVWGIGFWKNQVFGFTESGEFITIDTVTGAGTLVENNGLLWWGAAVTTQAPVID
jgi:hypothetical protein